MQHYFDLLTLGPLKMETVRSTKCLVEIVLHDDEGRKFQKTFIIDTVVKASQKTVFFEH
jgi:hypothetical protein